MSFATLGRTLHVKFINYLVYHYYNNGSHQQFIILYNMYIIQTCCFKVALNVIVRVNLLAFQLLIHINFNHTTAFYTPAGGLTPAGGQSPPAGVS